MNVDPSESNPTCSKYFNIEEIMWHILSLEIELKKKVIFLVWPLAGFFHDFQLRLLEFGFYLLVLVFYFSESVVGTLSYLRLTVRILESLCKNTPPKIRTISEAKKR